MHTDMERNESKIRKLRWVAGTLLGTLRLWGMKHFLFTGVQTPRFLTAPVRVADVEHSVLASGTIQPLKVVSVGAQASGRIVAMHVVLGDHVVKGQLIAEIDPSTQRN